MSDDLDRLEELVERPLPKRYMGARAADIAMRDAVLRQVVSGLIAVARQLRAEHLLCDGVAVSLGYDNAPQVPGVGSGKCLGCGTLAVFDAKLAKVLGDATREEAPVCAPGNPCLDVESCARCRTFPSGSGG